MRASKILWEFLQNALLMLPFVGAVWLWRESRNIAGVVACVAMSGVGGSVFMHYTETYITGKATASVQELLGSIVVTGGLSSVFVLYLGQSENWKLDILLGVIAGVVLSIAQYWISGGFSWVSHALAMSIASTICLLGFRLVISRSNNLQTGLGYATLIVLIVSVIIVSIDYA
ncbi:MAG: hypothetical protein GY832_36460 [Chloroflexi bacterium]|nr:hypothetical protein [Chloroflexota bacterium]